MTFAQPPAQHLAATPGEPPAPAGRPAVRIPLRTDRTSAEVTSFGPYIGQSPADGKGTRLTLRRACAGEPSIRHRDPKAQPFCATCGSWLADYPFNRTSLCKKCATKPEGDK